MPFTSKYVVKHYLEIGCKNHDIYAGIADGEKIVFVNMPEFYMKTAIEKQQTLAICFIV